MNSTEEITLVDFFSMEEADFVAVRYFRCLGLNTAEYQNFIEALIEVPRARPDNPSVFIGVGNITDSNTLLKNDVFLGCSRQGELKPHFTINNLIPVNAGSFFEESVAGAYFVIAVCVKPWNEVIAKQRLHALSSLARITLGPNFIYGTAIEYLINFKGQAVYTSASIELPQAAYGPFITKSDIFEIYSKIIDLGADNPYFRALDLVESSINELAVHKWFPHLWTALEILTFSNKNNGKLFPAMRCKLANAYGWNRHHDADDKLLLNELSEIRKEIVHNGYNPQLSASCKMLMLFLINDLIRHNLNLSFKGYAETFINSHQWEGLRQIIK